ncbi:uncharacterized protein [Ptychodera flava]|uniref:uncharacterized protein n=1 Tax=Ptychodera flava TaxID=63121 RepID=UPI00396A5CE0
MLRSVTKEIYYLMQTIGDLSVGQAKVLDFGEDSTILVAIAPDDGLYKGGQFIFRIRISKSYPLYAPDVACLTPIYHPNIENVLAFGETEADVCIDLLDDWESTYNLEHVVQAILFLFFQPNLEDPLSPMFEPRMDEIAFAENVRKSLEGGSVEGIKFPRNLLGEGCADDVTRPLQETKSVAVLANGKVAGDIPQSEGVYSRKSVFVT